MLLNALRIAACAAAAALAPGGLGALAAGSSAVFAQAEAVKRLTPEQRQERRFLQDEAAQLRFAGEAAPNNCASLPS